MRRTGTTPFKIPEVILGIAVATAFWVVVALFFQPSSTAAATLKDFAGPIATLLAATTAGWIAYRLGQGQLAVAESQAAIAERNWRTSNERVILDLFERRLAIYEEIRDCIGEVTRSGDAPDGVQRRYNVAIDRVPYFFGREVQSYLKKLRHHMLDLEFGNKMVRDDLRPDRSKWVDKVHDEFLAVTSFYNDAPALFGPYIQAHQKVSG